MPSSLKSLARKLRNKQTPEEIRLWRYLRRKQIHNAQFYRQRQLGKYIVDFYCPSKKLIIEIDGGQHYLDGHITKEDKIREKYFRDVLKLKVIRFTNIDIKNNLSEALEKIEQNM